MTPSRTGVQRDLDELKSFAITSHVKFNRSKIQNLHLEQGNPAISTDPREQHGAETGEDQAED